MSNKLNFYVQETPSGEIILNDPDVSLDGNASGHVKVFKTRKELAEYINPQVTTPAASAEDVHSKSKAWINEIDKAYGDHPKMNINAANAMCGGHQFHMANLAAQQYSVPFAASLPGQYDCNNCKGIRNAGGSCGCRSNAEKIKNDMEQQLLAKAETARTDSFVGDSKNVFVIKEQSKGVYKLFHHRGNRDPYTATIFGLGNSAPPHVCDELLSRLNLPDDCLNFYQPTAGKNAGDAQKTNKQAAVSNDEVLKLFHRAQAHGYQGRVQDYISALIAAKDFLRKQDADSVEDDSDIEQIARERKGDATVKVSLDDGKKSPIDCLTPIGREFLNSIDKREKNIKKDIKKFNAALDEDPLVQCKVLAEMVIKLIARVEELEIKMDDGK